MKNGVRSSETPEVGNPGTQRNNPKDLSFEYNFVQILGNIGVMLDGHVRKLNVSGYLIHNLQYEIFGGYFARTEATEA
jgi:hypothetical protein